MNTKLRVILSVSVLFAIVISTGSVNAQSLKNDSLYFCEEYKDSKEIGNSTEFYLPEKGGTITVMLRTAKAIGVVSVSLLVEKDVAGMREKISAEPFDIEAHWDYIFFADVFFPEPGKYKVSAVKKNGDVIASGYVRMLKGW
ncbi:MAG TPA: hypothetical protein PK605_15315 [Ignavibacteria bacterium]|nr:hypothetical protein [Bacteroidota bacterium]HRE12450.1 hypothetical protein [Ignavibacteria bacterium]HRF67539.1 hypothetical protein [Ignavibacteria bacterium]HRJ05772.1 hypothetical protein [Ignavibacteria bacterium]HRJ86533.1 hypothetical protein [Ignavibacteria bacterium]